MTGNERIKHYGNSKIVKKGTMADVLRNTDAAFVDWLVDQTSALKTDNIAEVVRDILLDVYYGDR
jgi:hypothetical protein